MTDSASQPTDEELRDFLAKLDEFHSSLPDSQKAFLEDLTGAALSRHTAEVEGFTAIEFPTIIAIIAVCIPQQGGQPPGTRQPVPGSDWIGRAATKTQ